MVARRAAGVRNRLRPRLAIAVRFSALPKSKRFTETNGAVLGQSMSSFVAVHARSPHLVTLYFVLGRGSKFTRSRVRCFGPVCGLRSAGSSSCMTCNMSLKDERLGSRLGRRQSRSGDTRGGFSLGSAGRALSLEGAT